MHGYTFGGHPVSCAVALANLDVMEAWTWSSNPSFYLHETLTRVIRVAQSAMHESGTAR